MCIMGSVIYGNTVLGRTESSLNDENKEYCSSRDKIDRMLKPQKEGLHPR